MIINIVLRIAGFYRMVIVECHEIFFDQCCYNLPILFHGKYFQFNNQFLCENSLSLEIFYPKLFILNIIYVNKKYFQNTSLRNGCDDLKIARVVKNNNNNNVLLYYWACLKSLIQFLIK